ncbi:MAG: site-2 protease family protein [Defluviitaleaceae bacterium]|nr:site-2 protease family protein [Defluviitaleaceae bacterium]
MPNISIQALLWSIPGVIIAVVLSEFTKSLIAYKMGDEGVKTQRRLTLNPLRHMDPLGSIFMLLFRFGWGKPVKLTPFAFKDKRKAMIILFFAPFLVNLLVGILFAVLSSFWAANMSYHEEMNRIIYGILLHTSFLNLNFAFLNILPIYPLNGILLINGINPQAGVKLIQLEKTLQAILALLIIFGAVSFVIRPIVGVIFNTFAGYIFQSVNFWLLI